MQHAPLSSEGHPTAPTSICADLKKDLEGRKEYVDYLATLEKQKAELRKRITANKEWIVSGVWLRVGRQMPDGTLKGGRMLRSAAHACCPNVAGGL